MPPKPAQICAVTTEVVKLQPFDVATTTIIIKGVPFNVTKSKRYQYKITPNGWYDLKSIDACSSTYLYWRWRVGKTKYSQYIGKVVREDLKI